MTLKESTEAAASLTPVMYNGIKYKRITQAGYRYDQEGKRHSFVQLLDETDRSVTYADPAKVEALEE